MCHKIWFYVDLWHDFEEDWTQVSDKKSFDTAMHIAIQISHPMGYKRRCKKKSNNFLFVWKGIYSSGEKTIHIYMYRYDIVQMAKS